MTTPGNCWTYSKIFLNNNLTRNLKIMEFESLVLLSLGKPACRVEIDVQLEGNLFG